VYKYVKIVSDIRYKKKNLLLLSFVLYNSVLRY